MGSESPGLRGIQNASSNIGISVYESIGNGQLIEFSPFTFKDTAYNIEYNINDSGWTALSEDLNVSYKQGRFDWDIRELNSSNVKVRINTEFNDSELSEWNESPVFQIEEYVELPNQPPTAPSILKPQDNSIEAGVAKVSWSASYDPDALFRSIPESELDGIDAYGMGWITSDNVAYGALNLFGRI